MRDYRSTLRHVALGLVVLAALLAPTSLSAVNSPPVKSGFPVTLTGGGSVMAGHPAIADLGLTPGHKSIIFATNQNKLYVVLYNGTVATGFPVTLPAQTSGSIAVGNIPIGGTSTPVIVVPYGSTFAPSEPGGVRAYNASGTLIWDRPSAEFDGATVPDPVIGSPVIGNIDGSGNIQVAWGSTDNNIYVVNGATGANLTGWPVAVRDSIRSSPALYDLFGTGKLNIIIGVDAHQEGAPYNTPNGGCLHVLRYDGTEVSGFPQCVNQTIVSSAAVGDINGDGKPEIVVGTGDYWSNATHAVYSFNCDGTQTTGWPVSVDGQVSTSPALADINGDGIPEVIVTDDNTPPSTTFHVYAFSGAGAQLWKTIPVSYYGTTPDAGDPVVADVTGDSNVEILVPVNSEAVVLSNLGAQLTDDGTHFAGSFSMLTESTIAAVDVDNFETTGTPVGVVAVSSSGSNTIVHVWAPKVSTNLPWSVFHQVVSRTGVETPAGTCASTGTGFYTVTPCRVVDTRNASGPYGGPALSGGQVRAFTVGGQCGIPTDAAAISANMTVVLPTTGGDLRAFPGTGTAPLASAINFQTGAVLANNIVLQLSSGQCSIQDDQASGSTNLLIDVNGYFK